MVRVDLSRIVFCIILGALSAGGLAACASPAATVAGEFPDLSLAETKSPAQLLRNEAAARLPESSIGEIVEAEDSSVACLSTNEDPDGLVRSWHSTVNVAIDDESQVATLVADLVASFVDQGWVARDLGGTATTQKKLLESDGSLTDIQVSGLVPDTGATSVSLEEVVDRPTVQIGVHGPCVRTAGGASDEVASLEKKKP